MWLLLLYRSLLHYFNVAKGERPPGGGLKVYLLATKIVLMLRKRSFFIALYF